MKKYIFLAFASSVIFTACNNEDSAIPTGENQKVNFAVEKTIARTVTTGNVTEFVTGDEIAITSSGLDIDMTNSTFTVTESGGLSGGSFYYDGDKKATFYAHYPMTSTYKSGTVSMDVAANQASEAAFNA